MDHADRLLHRAYVLVEAEIPASDAIEDLVTLAQGNVDHLRRARSQAETSGSEADPHALELAGFDLDLGQVATQQRSALGDLLDRAIACFS